MFVVGKRLVDSVKLRLVLRVYRYRYRNIFAVTAFPGFDGIFGCVRCMLRYDVEDDNFKVDAGQPHSFDGEVAGKLYG